MQSQGEGDRDDAVRHDEAEDLADAEPQPHVDRAHPRVEAEQLEGVGDDHDDAYALQTDADLDGVVPAVGGGVVDSAVLTTDVTVLCIVERVFIFFASFSFHGANLSPPVHTGSRHTP